MNTTLAVSEINGVPLFTKSGTPKTRYSDDERFRIIGGSKRDLEVFVELFCPGKPLYAATRGKTDDPRDWTTPRGRLQESDVLKHLVGNLTPGIKPRWIAPKTWEVTRWFGLDVDYRGDKEDFKRRKSFVIRLLKFLRIPRRAILVSITPSGGRHYRIFLKQKIRVSDIPIALARIGIKESSGKVEIFPKQTKGMRLPFGYLPGKQHDPRLWRNFIRNYRRGLIEKVCWYKLLKRITSIEKKRLARIATQSIAGDHPVKNPLHHTHQSRESIRPHRSTNMIQSRSVVTEDIEVAGGVGSKVLAYEQLLARKVEAPQDVKLLLELGIQKKGTRVEVTKRIAFHLLFVRQEPPDKVKEFLIAWVYRTGEHTSVDVMADNKKRTRTVERQTAYFVDWLVKNHENKQASLKSSKPSGDKQRVTDEELCIIRQHLQNVPQLPFLESSALNFLKFAKLHGKSTPEGWEAQVAIRGVVRRWPGCDGMRYKPIMDALKACGLVTMTRDKKQSSNGSGRPRTYLLRVAPSLVNEPTQTITQYDAVEPTIFDPASSTALSESVRTTTPCIENSDTYRKSISSSPIEVGTEIEEAQQAKLKTEINARLESELSNLKTHFTLVELVAVDYKLRRELNRLINENQLTRETAKVLSCENHGLVVPKPVPDHISDRLIPSRSESNGYLLHRHNDEALGKCVYDGRHVCHLDNDQRRVLKN